ncbi:MAG: sulfurtransferase [Planctomycetota bacterium]
MNTTPLISVAELLGIMNRDDAVIVDCRFNLADTEAGRRAYRQGHIPGAVYAHLDDDLSGEIIAGRTGRHPLPRVEDIAQTFSSWGIDSGVDVIVYDEITGPFAARLWWMLHWMGHQRVSVLAGGIRAYQAGGHPLASEIPTPTPRAFAPCAREAMVIDAQGAWQFAEDSKRILVDSRERDRFLGKEEPIDPVAGRIPGAVNIPFSRHLNEEGMFLGAEELANDFSAVVGATDALDIAFYCGSGVTAAHNILAYAAAGLGFPILYAGSWSDWICDPSRPIATGECD